MEEAGQITQCTCSGSAGGPPSPARAVGGAPSGSGGSAVGAVAGDAAPTLEERPTPTPGSLAVTEGRVGQWAQRGRGGSGPKPPHPATARGGGGGAPRDPATGPCQEMTLGSQFQACGAFSD